jgi:hypothetical protein
MPDEEKPALRAVTDIDAEVHEHWQKTKDAFARIEAEHGDACLTRREMCDRWKATTKKKALRVVDAALESSDIFDGLAAVSIHAEKNGTPGGFDFVVKTWCDREPRIYYTEEAIRAAVLWARGMGIRYDGWATPVNGG